MKREHKVDCIHFRILSKRQDNQYCELKNKNLLLSDCNDCKQKKSILKQIFSQKTKHKGLQTS